ncbi:MAG: CoA pyrophosphatase [Pseudomonadota bacterium]
MDRPLVESSVLIPVYRGADGEVRVVLIRRTSGGSHSGHLAFPGGKHDAGDKSMLDTALREAWEEIGIPASRIEILEHLPPAQTRNSGFRVYPFIGRVIQPVEWKRNEREVAEIMDLSVRGLIGTEVLEEDAAAALAPGRTPYYPVGKYQLWGLTFRILQGLAPRLLAGEWKI